MITSEDDGAMNVGFTDVGFLSSIEDPGALAQEYVRELPSGSDDLEPSSLTVVPNPTFRSLPASALGAEDTVVVATVIVTVSESELVPSDTVSVKVISPVVVGAVNVGFTAVLLESITVAPGFNQEYTRGSFSGSEEPEPSSVTVSPGATSRSSPASAVGVPDTVIVTVSVAGFVPSDTVSVKVISPVVVGAVNVGFWVRGPVS